MQFPNELAFECLTRNQMIMFGHFITTLLPRSTKNRPINNASLDILSTRMKIYFLTPHPG